MPQLDFETLVTALSGVSTACEPTEEPENHLDSPPESFWLSNDAEYDWWDRNAVYERNESTKGSSISISTNLNPNPNSASNSQRFSKNLRKSKATMIGLPKSQKASFAEARCHRRNHRPGNTTLFPKRSVSIGRKSDITVIEPSSPKVSCIGRVRSKRNRSRRLRTRQRSISSTATSVSVAILRQKSSRSQRKKKTGFFESVRSIFRNHRSGKSVQKSELPPGDSSATEKKSHNRKARDRNGSTASRTEDSLEESVYSEPPGLGSMNRFVSGRRSESWGVGGSEIKSCQ